MPKRQAGQYYTANNPFHHEAFYEWAKQAGLPNSIVLEPFAGTNNLIRYLKDLKLCDRYKSFDLYPISPEMGYRDSLSNFPHGFRVCVTNPPWLSKSSASERKISYPDTHFDNVYKLALANALYHCEYVAFLLPEAYIRTKLWMDRLFAFVSIEKPIFTDTEAPAGLALFYPKAVNDIRMYADDTYVGTKDELERLRPPQNYAQKIKMCVPEGNLGLITIDNTQGASIRFCTPDEISKESANRPRTFAMRIDVEGVKRLDIDKLNAILAKYREKTRDMLLGAFRGLRKDGRYRRVLDWGTARGIITESLSEGERQGLFDL